MAKNLKAIKVVYNIRFFLNINLVLKQEAPLTINTKLNFRCKNSHDLATHTQRNSFIISLVKLDIIIMAQASNEKKTVQGVFALNSLFKI